MSGHINDDIIDNVMARLLRSFLKSEIWERSCKDNLCKCLTEDGCRGSALRITGFAGGFKEPMQGVGNIRVDGTGRYNRISRLPCQKPVSVCACKGGRCEKLEGTGLL